MNEAMKSLRKLTRKLKRRRIAVTGIMLLGSSVSLSAASSQTSKQFCTKMERSVLEGLEQARDSLRDRRQAQEIKRIKWKYKTYLEICPNLKSLDPKIFTNTRAKRPTAAPKKSVLRKKAKGKITSDLYINYDYQKSYILAVPLVCVIVFWKLYF